MGSCIEPEHGGIPCPEQNTEKESQSCNAPACWTDYSQWSSCQGFCGQTGKQTRTRNCIQPESGGLPSMRPLRHKNRIVIPMDYGYSESKLLTAKTLLKI